MTTSQEKGNPLNHSCQAKTNSFVKKAVSKKFGRLSHGNKHGVSFTDTIMFIAKNLVPHNKRATYASFIFDLKPLKADPYRCRIVVGGDRLNYFDDAS